MRRILRVRVNTNVNFNTNGLANSLDRITETYARKMANDTAHGAPVDTGKLKNSFPSSVTKEGTAKWSYGSDLPYAVRQEYEHHSRKGFIRKAIWDNETAYRDRIQQEVERGV